MRDIYNVIFQEEIPKYVQISNHIKRLIETKNIEDGEKLPTIREYTNYLGVNKVTIINAYNKLQNDGFAYQKVGSGTYAKVKEVRRSFSKEYSRVFRKLSSGNTKDAIDFAGETNNEVVFPIEEFKSIINKVLDRDGAEALISQNALGYENLRYTINEVFWDNSIDNESILIVSGAQQGIDIASKAILNINDNVIVEKPTYGGALSVFKWRRANIFEVEMEKDGVNLDGFEEILKKNRIRCFYTMSYFQNPTGISYSLEKKKKLIELAEKYDFYIIEDDYLSELIYEESVEYIPFKWLDRSDRVIYIKSFSKIFLIKKKENKPSSKIEHTDNFNKKEINIKATNSTILEEVAIEKLPVNDEIETTSHGLNSESKLPFEIKIPKNFKGRRRILKVDFDLNEINFLNSNEYSLEDLKKDFRDLKLNSDFIKNINSDSLESNRDKSLEERVCNLEKKINELEEFFLEIFQAMSNK